MPASSESMSNPAAHGKDAAGRPAPKQSRLRRFLAACIIAFGFLYLALLGLSSFPRDNAAQRDFIEYWAAGRLILHHANPYDQQAIYALEKQAGMHRDRARISISPPVALELAAPLGLVGPTLGLVLWLLAELGCLGISLWLLWVVFGRPNSRYHLLGFLFAPTIACQLAGQIGIFLLLSLALFLYLHRTQPFLAGAVLLPFALKPHLFLPFAVALLLWMIVSRRFSLAFGWATSLGASCAISLYFDPRAWAHYFKLMREFRILDAFIPALSVALRFLIHPAAVWIEFVPEILACAWAAWFFWTRREQWNWCDHGLLVLLVAAFCAPYGWFFDESVLFPAILAGIYRAVAARKSVAPIFVIGTCALVETVLGTPLQGYHYIWTTPACLGWYLYATWPTRRAAQTSTSPAESELQV